MLDIVLLLYYNIICVWCSNSIFKKKPKNKSDNQQCNNRCENERKTLNLKYVAKLLTGLLSKLCSCFCITRVREHTENIATFREAERGSSMRQQILATVCWRDFKHPCLIFENTPPGRTHWPCSTSSHVKYRQLNSESRDWMGSLCSWLWDSDQNIIAMLLKS